jgi:hypothetical protein
MGYFHTLSVLGWANFPLFANAVVSCVRVRGCFDWGDFKPPLLGLRRMEGVDSPGPTEGDDNGGSLMSWKEKVGERPRFRLVGESSMYSGG